jgi:hypothetical protein
MGSCCIVWSGICVEKSVQFFTIDIFSIFITIFLKIKKKNKWNI